MTKTILITGATDGIGLLTAKGLAAQGHNLLIHGRNPEKLQRAAEEIGGTTERYTADLSKLDEVAAMADQIRDDHDRIDVVINNAGVYKTPQPLTADGKDIRFVVNTLAPWLLTQKLLPILPAEGRVVNLSSAAQAAVSPQAIAGQQRLDDFEAYAQSKLAITIWTQELAREMPDGPVFIAVNPGSLLASKMVKEGFGVAGNDLGIGADILTRAALDAEFADASGKYFDNDAGRFSPPHQAASDRAHVDALMQAIRDQVSV